MMITTYNTGNERHVHLPEHITKRYEYIYCTFVKGKPETHTLRYKLKNKNSKEKVIRGFDEIQEYLKIICQYD